MLDLNAALPRLADLAAAAGRAIMGVYAAPFDVARKTDGSPLTAADLAAEAVISAGLPAVLPGVPVVSEEGAPAARGLGAAGEAFVLVDPLDGTREFVDRTGEFTVNIAVVVGGRPLAGVVYAPVSGRLWMGVAGMGARTAEVAAEAGALGAAPTRAIAARPRPAGGLVAVASRSHLDPATAAFLADLPIADRRAIGSSLKFCLLAEGEADVYPRFGPTMEWDTAAGHAVLAAAGGSVTAPDGSPFGYGKAALGYLNGPFVAWGAPPVQARP